MAREGRYAPLVVTLESAGRKVDVEVRVDVWRGSELRGTLSRQRFSKALLLAGGTSRRVPFVIPIAFNPRSIDVRVFSGGQEIARREIDLRPAVTGDRLVVGISSELSLDFLSSLSGAGGNVRVVYPHVENLPESWAGYDGIELVVVRDTSFQRLRTAQVEALERWVVSGGTLVFSGGAAALQYASAGFGNLLPVEVTGLRERDGLPSLAAFLREAERPRGRVTLAASRAAGGTVLVSDDGMPVLVQRRLGQGTVWFTAFDSTLPPFDSWRGTLSLWRLLAENGREPLLGAVFRSPRDDPWMKTLLDAPSMSFPSRFSLLGLSGLYLLLLAPLAAGRLARGPRGRVRAVLLAAAPVLACVAAFLLFNGALFPPGARLLDAAKVEVVPGSGFARVTQEIGFFATRAGSYDVSIGSVDAVLGEIGPALATPAREGPDFTIDTRDGTVLRGVALSPFQARLFALSAVVEQPLEAALAVEGQAVSVSIVNRSARALRGCFLARGGIAYPIGDLGPGEKRSLTFAPADGIDLRDPPSRVRLLGGAQRASFWDREYGVLGKGKTLAAAWLDGPAIPVRRDAGPGLVELPALSLVVMEVP